jgi:predicted permease
LLLRSFVGLLEVDLGFRPENAVMWQLDAGRDFPNTESKFAYFHDLFARVQELPGVEAVGATDTPPLGRNRGWGIRPKGAEYEKDKWQGVFPRLVNDTYLRAIGIPLVAGRQFTPNDNAKSAKVVIINRTGAKQLFRGADPIGRTVLIVDGEWQVVGVVADVRHQALDQDSGIEAYIPYEQLPWFGTLSMVVRSRVAPPALVRSVGAALRSLDPALPVDDHETLEGVVDQAVSPRRFILQILAGFAGTALLLAGLGIYAVLSYSVTQRVREIGIRMALGESAGSVRGRVVRRTVVLAALGTGIGAAVSLAASGLLRSMLYGVGPTDAISLGGTAVVLLLVSALAGWLPARRASKTDPIVALRSV